MSDFHNVPVTIIGASRGLGRVLAQNFHAQGAKVLAVARGRAGLDALARELPGVSVFACDAASPDAPEQVFAVQIPRILILCGGAVPRCVPMTELDWNAFSIEWNTDTRMSFNFLQAALKQPLPNGTTVITITSGAMINGSPISGGYAGAKKMQQFLSGYAQREAGRAGLDLRFLTLAPGRVIEGTDAGTAAINGYAAYNGTTVAGFIADMGPKLTLQYVSDTLFGLVKDAAPGGNFVVFPDGVKALT
jgi:NAD(P)-dependent dehydrogenase (short-subunit alcohol dehydrogenase family)